MVKKKKRRNYRREYDQFFGKVGQLTATHKKRRKEKTARNRSRRQVLKATAKTYKLGSSSQNMSKARQALSGLDVDHKDNNPLNGATSNLQVLPPSINRARHGDTVFRKSKGKKYKLKSL